MKKYQIKAKRHQFLQATKAKEGRKKEAKYHDEVSKGITAKRRNLTHGEKRKVYKSLKAFDAAKSLGATPKTAAFVANATMGKTFRVRYGYIDENDLGSDKNSKVTKTYKSLEEATKRYNDLGWLRGRDKKGRKFIRIEASSDGGKTWPTKLFHDAQH